MTDYRKINPSKIKMFAVKCLQYLIRVVTYFTAQSKFDRAQLSKAITPQSIFNAKQAKDAYWKAKKESGRLEVNFGGVITSEKPFPPRGSLLTEEERKDPLAL